MPRQWVFSRLAEYEDTNDADRTSVDPTIRHVVGGRAKTKLVGQGPFGESRLMVWMLDPGRGLDRIVIDTGGVVGSYLGLPESFRGRK